MRYKESQLKVPKILSGFPTNLLVIKLRKGPFGPHRNRSRAKYLPISTLTESLTCTSRNKGYLLILFLFHLRCLHRPAWFQGLTAPIILHPQYPTSLPWITTEARIFHQTFQVIVGWSKILESTLNVLKVMQHDTTPSNRQKKTPKVKKKTFSSAARPSWHHIAPELKTNSVGPWPQTTGNWSVEKSNPAGAKPNQIQQLSLKGAWWPPKGKTIKTANAHATR